MLNISQYKDITVGQGIRSLPGWKMAVYLYVVDGLLIDAGPESMKGPISKFLQENRVEQVALTHIHEDHSGMSAWLQRQMNVPVYIHEKAIPEAKQKANLRFYRRLTWGQRPAFDERLERQGRQGRDDEPLERDRQFFHISALLRVPQPVSANVSTAIGSCQTSTNM